MRGRARANPGAVFAIGAGLAWFFARHPPITLTMVGLGLTSLMRTDPAQRESPIVTRATELADWAAHDGRDLIGQATERAREFGLDAKQAAAQTLSQAVSGADAAAELARGSYRAASDLAHASYERTSDLAQSSHDAAPPFDSETRDSFLLGVAGLAVAAAAAISWTRND